LQLYPRWGLLSKWTCIYFFWFFLEYNDNNFIQAILIFGIPAIPFIFWEYQIRQFRKENGLSIYKNIEEDLIQTEINEQIARE